MRCSKNVGGGFSITFKVDIVQVIKLSLTTVIVVLANHMEIFFWPSIYIENYYAMIVVINDSRLRR